MAEKLTPQQEQAIRDRGGKLLVSAAAGSGKTKVLVDRLMSYLLDPVDPANIDEFLIITYTKAAASELRGKIAAKLSERIAEMPENRHLQQQLQRLYMTNISTVHSFCGDLLRQFAYRLDLSADFRVADENECRQIRTEVVAQVLEDAYDRASEDGDFRTFVDTQGIGRDDRKLPDVLLKVYDSARCHLDPDAWLQSCLDAVHVTDVDDISQTPWGAYLTQELFVYLDLQIPAMEQCVQLAKDTEGLEKVAANLSSSLAALRRLRAASSWDEIVSRKDIPYDRMTFPKKGIDEDVKDGIKAVRNACKEDLPKLTRCFTDPSERVLKDLQGSAEAVRGMVKLVKDFWDAYDAAKRRRRILDFGDLEHRTLDLLLGTKRSAPTAIAREIGGRFREVMVDEYQDSNAVQDAIYSALTEKRQNCFMVGDVKQSIYQFRLADPGIFLEKYNTFCPAEQAQPGQGRKVLLSKNFRSGGAALSAVNCVFETCMSPAVGGLYYGKDEALHEGVPHASLHEPEVELYGIEVRDETYAEEPAFVAHRIRELLDGTHMVRDKEGERPIREEDIVILLRSPGSIGEKFRLTLEKQGIRCTSGGGEDLLKTEEIGVLRSILQAIHNPQLDIPLLAAMASPVFGFTADELAKFRGKHLKCSVFDALQQDESEKSKEFVKTLKELRWEARLETLPELLESIFQRTRMDSLYGAVEDGVVKSANLQVFYQLAVDFGAVGPSELGRFLEHLDAMEEKGLITGSENTDRGCVTIMSIHKSKGLEFPVVFLCGLSRNFNKESQREQVLCHKDLGVGLSAADQDRRVRYPTVIKRAIAQRMGQDSLSEELRVLYVAMTRAKDRLIMTYAAEKLADELQELVDRINMGCMDLLIREANCPGQWVLLAALGRTEAGELFRLGGNPNETKVGDYPWLIRVVHANTGEQGADASEETVKPLPPEVIEGLRRSLDFEYAYTAATAAPSKQTATQRKGRLKDQEAAENAQEPKHKARSWRKPGFAESGTEGRDYGSAIHAALQYIRYEACTDVDHVRQEIDRLVAERFISEKQGELVDCGKLARFFATDLGRKLRREKDVLREFKFSILDDGSDYGDGLEGERILLQGVVDCALMEEDGITVVDFKTDRVTEETVAGAAERYRPQVEAYADALSRIFEKRIKEKCLYFFNLERFVEL